MTRDMIQAEFGVERQEVVARRVAQLERQISTLDEDTANLERRMSVIAKVQAHQGVPASVVVAAAIEARETRDRLAKKHGQRQQTVRELEEVRGELSRLRAICRWGDNL